MERFLYQFGPLLTATGVVFRLWAPEVRSIALELDGTPHQMNAVGDGWYHSAPLSAPEGSLYGFRINDDLLVPDPASRLQQNDVHGRSVLQFPRVSATATTVPAGAMRPWVETVLYEVHVGTFTPQGTFSSIIPELPRLSALGVTALELMPLADFPGEQNWGYDGVLPFAPDRTYGTPDELRSLIHSAGTAGLSVWLDVVYNHFGPEGNYLHVYAPQFFSEAIVTPWGPGIDFSRREVRQFFIENAVYWTTEYDIAGLRLDAVHAIEDPAAIAGKHPHILTELANTVRTLAPEGRPVHLVLENDRNQRSFLGISPEQYTAQWNDDMHHLLHVLLTGENFGYYHEYATETESKLMHALCNGFLRPEEGDSAVRVPIERDAPVPPPRCITFLQNHDQIGNRAWGERLTTLAPPEAIRAATMVQLLSPQIPLIFMGEEWGATTPFRFFCDLGAELADAVREGRRREFGLSEIPDPLDPQSRVDSTLTPPADGREQAFYANLLQLRRKELMPLLATMQPGTARGGGATVPVISWPAERGNWTIACNLQNAARQLPPAVSPGRLVAAFPEMDTSREHSTTMPPWSVCVWKETV